MRRFKMTYENTEYIVEQLHDEAPAVITTTDDEHVTLVWPFPGLGASQEMMEARVREHMKDIRKTHDQ